MSMERSLERQYGVGNAEFLEAADDLEKKILSLYLVELKAIVDEQKINADCFYLKNP